MVGNSLRLCSARSCFLAEEIDWTEGGASAGTGVERPLHFTQLCPVQMKVITYLVCPDALPLCKLSATANSVDRDARSTAGCPGLTARGRRICSWLTCPLPVPISAEEDMLCLTIRCGVE